MKFNIEFKVKTNIGIKAKIIFLFLVIFIFNFKIHAKEPILKVKSKILINNQEKISFKNWAEIENFDRNSISKIKQIKLDNDFTCDQIVSDKKMLKKIKKHISSIEALIKKRIKVKIPYLSFIKCSYSFISNNILEKTILNNAKKYCPDCLFKLESLKKPDWPNIKDIKGKINWSIKFPNRFIKGNFLLPLHIDVKDSSTNKIVWIKGFLSVYKKVPILIRKVSPNTRISLNDIKYEKLDITREFNEIPSEEELKGAKLKYNAKLNEPVFKKDILRERAIQVGQMVKVLNKKEKFSISYVLRAQQSGFVGDIISLINPKNKKIITGEIIAKGVAKTK